MLIKLNVWDAWYQGIDKTIDVVYFAYICYVFKKNTSQFSNTHIGALATW